ncbi:hypothetical protein ABVN80_08120 [Acinetobacter baumannii]
MSLEKGKPRALDELVGVRDTPTMCQLINERFPDHDITVIPDASGRGNIIKELR